MGPFSLLLVLRILPSLPVLLFTIMILPSYSHHRHEHHRYCCHHQPGRFCLWSVAFIEPVRLLGLRGGLCLNWATSTIRSSCYHTLTHIYTPNGETPPTTTDQKEKIDLLWEIRRPQQTTTSSPLRSRQPTSNQFNHYPHSDTQIPKKKRRQLRQNNPYDHRCRN